MLDGLLKMLFFKLRLLKLAMVRLKRHKIQAEVLFDQYYLTEVFCHLLFN